MFSLCRRQRWLGRARGFSYRRFDWKIVRLGFDLLQGRLHIRVVRAALEDGFVFEDGRRKLAHLHVGLSDAFGRADHVLLPAQLGISLFENLQRLVVVGLRLSDDFEHLNRLSQLRFFTRTQCAHHANLISPGLGPFIGRN